MTVRRTVMETVGDDHFTLTCIVGADPVGSTATERADGDWWLADHPDRVWPGWSAFAVDLDQCATVRRTALSAREGRRVSDPPSPRFPPPYSRRRSLRRFFCFHANWRSAHPVPTDCRDRQCGADPEGGGPTV